MDLLNIKNKAQIHEFYRLDRGNQATVLKFGYLFGEMEVCNKCKISAQYLQNYAY